MTAPSHASISIGRDAYARRAWAEAFDALTQASATGPLDANDAERLAWSAMLSGRTDASFDAFERLYEIRLASGEGLRAARTAFWLGMRLMSLGQTARGGGWLARAQHLVEGNPDCVECGYMRLPLAFRFSLAGDHGAAGAAAAEAIEIADRHHDRDLGALARAYTGSALIRQGRLSEGLPMLDEAMVAVSSDNVLPVVTGLVYCEAISACQRSHALDRAREWTAGLSAWCDAQPQLVPFAGACLVHRSEVMQFSGAWSDAFEEAHRVLTRFGQSRADAAGSACYQEGEIHRLRGELADAEHAYRLASEERTRSTPGLALLRVAQDRVDLAAAATRRVMSVTTDPLQRTRFLPAHVEILLAASEIGEARAAAEELGALADRVRHGRAERDGATREGRGRAGGRRRPQRDSRAAPRARGLAACRGAVFERPHSTTIGARVSRARRRGRRSPRARRREKGVRPTWRGTRRARGRCDGHACDGHDCRIPT